MLFRSDGFNSGGYDWCNQSWGTKWGFCDPEITGEVEQKGGKLRLDYHFDTAWSPPIPLIQKLGELFPKLNITLRYWERGMGFRGKLQMVGGEVVHDMTDTYAGNRGG